jgi:hypothetical protein
MTTSTKCPDKASLVCFLYDEFDPAVEPSAGETKAEISRHLRECSACANEVAALGDVRQHLTAWVAPDTSPQFRLIRGAVGAERDATLRPRRWAGWFGAPQSSGLGTSRWPLAAAAVLVLATALGLARLDVRVDGQGLHVRTGWGHPPRTNAPVTNATVTNDAATNVPSDSVATASVAPAGAPLKKELEAFKASVDRELAALRQATQAAAGRSASSDSAAGSADTALLRRVRQLIDESEVRQQQNLAVRITELSRDFDLQRRSDLVQIEQGFGRLAGQREAEAAEQRRLINAIRVSQQRP